MKKVIIISTGFLLAPLVSFAAPPRTFAELVTIILEIIRDLFSFIMVCLMVFFLYGLMRFILASGDQRAVEQGKKFMLWGLLALFVAFSFWGLVGIIVNTFL